MVSIGAASGFGLACTKRFVQEGCKVVATDINGEGLAKVYSSEDHNIAGMFELRSQSNSSGLPAVGTTYLQTFPIHP